MARERVKPTATCGCCGRHDVAVNSKGTLHAHGSKSAPWHKCEQAQASAFKGERCEALVVEGLRELLKEAKKDMNDNERGPDGNIESDLRRDVRQALDLHPMDHDAKIVAETQRLKRLEQACRDFIAAPHPDHFAARLGDEELVALERIKREAGAR